MALAQRLSNLGTETAFAVSLAAADWASKGNRVFPFHLGDINLPTPANVVAAMDKAIAEGKTGYCAAAGIAPLREALAHDVASRRGLQYSPANVVVQPGGKPVIGKFIQSVMNPGESVLYPNPGYPIYESMIEYYGGTALAYRYHQTDRGFAIDLDHLRSLITPSTRAIVYNNLQNPLGCESTPEEMQAIADIAIEHDLWVLADEAYFEMRYSGESTSIASLPGMYDRTVILYTFSKKFAMTGWRLGAAIGPTAIAERFARRPARHPRRAAAPSRCGVGRAGPDRRSRVPQARVDLLPVPEGHRCHGAHGIQRRRVVRHGRAPPHRRVVLHPNALRPPAAR